MIFFSKVHISGEKGANEFKIYKKVCLVFFEVLTQFFLSILQSAVKRAFTTMRMEEVTLNPWKHQKRIHKKFLINKNMMRLSMR